MTATRQVDWSTLRHAYGIAVDIPAHLELIREFPPESDWQSDPWFSLWSALYHQGDIYSASLAAVPPIVSVVAQEPQKATLSFYLLPASIAIADHERPLDVAPEIRRSFEDAVLVLGAVATTALPRIADPDLAMAARASAMIARGMYQQAGELLEADA